ncbi:MAG: hypothetical protein PHY31_10925, partial [Smithellaceae bacterium]|nr:hypothetical protein [Smithellaceae bacterium]
MDRKKMKDRYRHFSWLSDVSGIKNALGELRGVGHPRQPKLRKPDVPVDGSVFNEEWFIRAIKRKVENHPGNTMEYPFFGERIFD